MKKIRNFWIVIILLIIINVIFYLARPGGERVLLYISDGLPVICSLISVFCLIAAYRSLRRFDYIKSAWLMILIGIFSFFVAESIYGMQEIGFKLDMNKNFPGIADIFWCFGYIPMFFGLIIIFYGYKKSGLPMGDLLLYLFIAITVFFLAAIIIYFLLIPIVQDTETSTSAKFAYLFYPVADLTLVIPSLVLIYITSLFGSGQITKPLKYLAFGFLLITVADLLYSYLGWKDLYGSGNLIDVSWHLGYLFIGLAGLYQSQLIESLKTN
jgi:hypothetical protein